MYKSRREIEPTIPRCADEFFQQIILTHYGVYFRGEVIVVADIGIFFYSDKIAIQFFQLWTIFVRIGRHVIPCIHCLLTSKKETSVFPALLYKIHEYLPQLSPTHGMSDWERAARNAVTTVFPGTHLHGCHFHSPQNIWQKLQN